MTCGTEQNSVLIQWRIGPLGFYYFSVHGDGAVTDITTAAADVTTSTAVVVGGRRLVSYEGFSFVNYFRASLQRMLQRKENGRNSFSRLVNITIIHLRSIRHARPTTN